MLALSLLAPVAVSAQTAAPATSPAAATPSQAAARAGTGGSIDLAEPIGGKTNVSGLPEYIVTLYQYALGIVTIVAIIMMIVGGFKYLMSASVSKIEDGKKTIADVIGGMVILFMAYVILYNINPKTVNLSLPNITTIRGIAVDSQTTAAGQSCAKDGDCQAGAKCLRISSAGGICSDGSQGRMCKCEGAGCTVSAEQAGGPTNNNGTGQVACNAGLPCAEISNGHWVCNGGTGAACNESASYSFSPTATRGGQAAAAGGAVASTVIGIPFAPLVAAAVYATASDTSTAGSRGAVHCTQPGQYCFQTTESLAGACVYGDPRDTAMFAGIPAYSQNQDLLQAVTRCDLTDADLRNTPKALGGCRSVTGSDVDQFCVSHRYHCSSGASCGLTDNASMFADTLRVYYSWENVPTQMKPEYYFKQGCTKPPGSACQSDTDCSAKCTNNHCSGFTGLTVASSVTPGSLRGLPAVGQVEIVESSSGCGATTWSETDLLHQAESVDLSAQQAALGVLFQAGTPDRFACYPKRPAASKCDLNAQCTSGTCTLPASVPRVSMPSSFNNPMDNTAGLGTCT